MSADLVRANILLDTISTTALDIYNSPMNQNLWTDPSQVPRFIYTSLSDLVSGFGPLSSNVISDYGLAEIPANACIIIQPSETMKSNTGDFLESDITGAYYMEFNILVKNLRTSKDLYLTRDMGLRLIYILDHGIRGNSYNQFSNAHAETSPDLFIIGDNTIYPGAECPMKWRGSDILRVSQWNLRFCLDSVFMFVPFGGGFN